MRGKINSKYVVYDEDSFNENNFMQEQFTAVVKNYDKTQSAAAHDAIELFAKKHNL